MRSASRSRPDRLAPSRTPARSCLPFVPATKSTTGLRRRLDSLRHAPARIRRQIRAPRASDEELESRCLAAATPVTASHAEGRRADLHQSCRGGRCAPLAPCAADSFGQQRRQRGRDAALEFVVGFEKNLWVIRSCLILRSGNRAAPALQPSSCCIQPTIAIELVSCGLVHDALSTSTERSVERQRPRMTAIASARHRRCAVEHRCPCTARVRRSHCCSC